MEAEEARAEAERLVTQARALSQRAASHSKRLAAESATLAEEVRSLSQAVARAAARAAAAPPGAAAAWAPVGRALDEARAVVAGGGPGGNLAALAGGRRSPPLLRLMLGPSANVVSWRREDSIRLKEEYHAFRNRSAYTMAALAAALRFGIWRAKRVAAANEPFSLAPVALVGTQLFLCWLLYFYTATALRESVLKVNGSHIRSWWITHHHWAIATSMLMLSLPVDSPSFVRFIELFLSWAVLQAVVIVLQNRYQRRRMYTRVALGKSAAMDVVSGESSGGHDQLLLLVPFLFAMQGLQLYIGANMLLATYPALLTAEGFADPEARESDLWGRRGVALAGGMMALMAAKNFRHTVATVVDKQRTRAAERRRAAAAAAAGGARKQE